MSKSVRKKNNNSKRMERLGTAVMKNLAVFLLIGSNPKCEMVDLKRMTKFKATPALATTIEKGRYKWTVFCAVFCRSQHGEEYMKSLVIESPSPCLQGDLVELLHEHHVALLEECNEAHLITAGWMASPTGIDWSEKLAGDIFSKMNAWENLAKWEVNNVA